MIYLACSDITQVSMARVLVKFVAIKRRKMSHDFERNWSSGLKRGMVKKIVELCNRSLEVDDGESSFSTMSTRQDDLKLLSQTISPQAVEATEEIHDSERPASPISTIIACNSKNESKRDMEDNSITFPQTSSSESSVTSLPLDELALLTHLPSSRQRYSDHSSDLSSDSGSDINNEVQCRNASENTIINENQTRSYQNKDIVATFCFSSIINQHEDTMVN